MDAQYLTGNKMPLLPYRNTTKFYLDKKIINNKFGRPYLGMSSIGEPCVAKLWYGFHWVSEKRITSRTQRIFDTGHLFEAIAIAELKSIGCSVYKIENGRKVEMTGAPEEDQETLMGCFGHVSGHSDGRIIGLVENPNLEHLLELKTMKEEYFLKVKKLGVEESQPTYYAQVQRYMKEKKIKRAFFLAINKNTSEYYTEFIDYNDGFAKELVRKETEIIMSDRPMQKEYIEGYYRCFNCDHNKVCHQGYEPAMNCRTCKYSDLAPKGEWICTNPKHNDLYSEGRCEDDYSLSVEEQEKGCEFYKKGWNL